jgi:hypothetical protein
MSTRASTKRRALRRYLSPAEVRAARRALDREINRRSADWGIHGWSIVGTPPRMRVQVHVKMMLRQPRRPIDTIPLPASVGGGHLKLAVRATHSHLPPRRESNGSNGHLAPGAPLTAAGHGPSARIGAAGFVVTEDGVRYLLTCGHAFPPGGGHVEVSREPVAHVTHNAFHSDGLDAALCRLTEDGVQLARSSRDAPTWLRRVHRARAEDNGRDVVFYPTHDATPPFVEQVESYSARETIAGASLRDLVTLRECTTPGDSGSLLAMDDAYYALCTGTSGALSCFTSIHLALTHFRDQLGGIKIWTPRSDS